MKQLSNKFPGFLAIFFFCINANGQNVGVGIDTPQAKLHVNGTFKIQNGVTVNGISADSTLTPGSDSLLPTQRAIKRYMEKGSWAPKNGQLDTAFVFKDSSGTNLSAPQHIEIQGNYAYVTSFVNNSLSIFDISNPDAIIPRGSTSTNLNGPYDLEVQGNYAYVVNYNGNSFSIFDISNPDNIDPKSTFPSSFLAAPTGIALKGNYAYITSYSNNILSWFNISNPSSISLGGASGYPILQNGTAICIKGDFAYITAEGTNNLLSLDISNPSFTSITSTANFGLAGPQDVMVSGNYAYVTSYFNNRLSIFDVSSPFIIQSRGTVGNSLAGPLEVFVNNNYAYVTSFLNDKLCMYDVSNPIEPFFVDSVSTNLDGPRAVAVQGDYSFVTSRLNGRLEVFKREVPSIPRELTMDDNGNIAFTAPTWTVSGTNIYRRTGNIGIGNSSPQQTLDVTGNGIFSGNLGIGNTAPQQKLDVTGNGIVSGNLGIGNTAPQQKLDVTGNGTFSGNLGIGRNAVSTRLHVAGNQKIDSTFTIELGAGMFGKENNAGKIGYQAFTPGTLDITGAGTNSSNRKIKFWAEGGSSFTGDINTGKSLIGTGLNIAGDAIIHDSLAIGLAVPANRLSVAGRANIDSLGLGIISPEAKLDVNGSLLLRGTNTNNYSSTLKAGVELFTGRGLTGTLNPGQTLADMAFNFGGTGGGYRHFISTRHQNQSNIPGNAIDFYINNSSIAEGSFEPGTGNRLQLSISAAGVGIGGAVTNNNYKLQVSGNTNIQGTTVMTDTLYVPVISQDAFTAPTLLNGWVNSGTIYADAGFYKDKSGVVRLQGLVKNGSIAGNTILLKLPVGYRPSATLAFTLSNNASFADCYIDGNGDVRIFPNNNVWLSLSNISFRAMQ